MPKCLSQMQTSKTDIAVHRMSLSTSRADERCAWAELSRATDEDSVEVSSSHCTHNQLKILHYSIQSSERQQHHRQHSSSWLKSGFLLKYPCNIWLMNSKHSAQFFVWYAKQYQNIIHTVHLYIAQYIIWQTFNNNIQLDWNITTVAVPGKPFVYVCVSSSWKQSNNILSQSKTVGTASHYYNTHGWNVDRWSLLHNTVQIDVADPSLRPHSKFSCRKDITNWIWISELLR